MNIQELQDFNLADAAKFHFRLNPKIWGSDEHLLPEVKQNLLEIAEDFREFLGIPELDIKDITISGSNAAYSYTDKSDIDLHLVVAFPEGKQSEIYRELFDAKKFQYNELHDYKIGDADVELYVQDAEQPHASQGIYSLLGNKWISVPRRVKAEIDHSEVQNKYEDFGHRIERAIESNDLEVQKKTLDRLKAMRQTGLQNHGEFGAENLAFKMLRNTGLIQQLWDAYYKAKSEKLSLEEKRKEKFKKPFVYGYTEDVSHNPDGVSASTCMELNETDVEEDVSHNENGVSASTCMELNEDSAEATLQKFIEFCVNELGLEKLPIIKLRKDPQWPKVNKTFGKYNDAKGTLEVAWGQRHLMDIFRTVAHELTHAKQHERESVPHTAGETGSPFENEANARAGILMRDWGQTHPELFDVSAEEVDTQLGSPEVLEKDSQPASTDYIRDFKTNHPKPARVRPLKVKESASGYIPTKKQAKDPRYVMALTQDIKPGQVGKEANKLNLKTDSQGHPQIAKANGLVEALALQLAQFKKSGTLLESEELDEVNMSPSALRKFAQSDAAKGMLAGFELEMCIPDTSVEDDDYEMEPDYDMDERAYSISGVIDFFTGGDYGIGSREAERLSEQLYENFYEWANQQAYEDWKGDDGREFFEERLRDDWESNDTWDEKVREVLMNDVDTTDDLFGTDEKEMEEHLDRVIEAGKKAPKFTSSQEQITYAKEHPDYQLYLDANDAVEEIFQEEVESEWEKADSRIYNDTQEEFIQDRQDNIDAEEWLDQENLRWMSDIANSYDLEWPYLTGGSNGGSNSLEDRADSLARSLGMKVEASTGYHSARRTNDKFILEPDSSIDTDEREDAGLELISPPLPIEECIEKLQAAIDWAQSNGCYTNDSTGLHMGVSLPSQSTENLDYVKLALFLGDEHVLKDFGREANHFTKAAIKDIKSKAKGKDVTELLDNIRNGLADVASKSIASTSPGKYSSINIKDGYVEFRSAGGDTLSRESNEGTQFLENTLYRYVQAMAIAGNPEAEKKEYAKKLYKLIAPEGGDQSLALFAKFAAGDIDKETLKTKWAETVLDKEKPEVPGNWELVNKETGEREFYISNKLHADAMQQAKEEVGSRNLDKYVLKKAKASPEFTEWDCYNIDTGEVIDTIKSKSREEAWDYFADKFKDRPDVSKLGIQPHKPSDIENEPAPKELSKRAKLAQQIKTKQEKEKSGPDLSDEPGEWEFYNTQSNFVLDRINNATKAQADIVRKDTARRRDLDADLVGMRRVEQKKYSSYADAQRAADELNLPSTNPNPTLDDPNQVRMPNGVPVWEIYNRETGDVVNAITDHTAREAWAVAQGWLRSVDLGDPSNFSIRPKLLAQGERNTAGANTPATSGQRFNYEIYNRDNPSVAVRRFYADNHPAAMQELEDYRRTASFAPSQYALRNL